MKFLNRLNLKVPPLVQVLIIAILMWGTQKFSGHQVEQSILRWGGSLILFLIGSIIALLGVLEFKRRATTVDPRYPDKSSNIVSSGIYAYSRNPMYVGMLLWLLSLCLFLGNPPLLIYCIIFVLYMTQFQIKPEEEVLLGIFQGEFERYKAKVRRWL